MLWLEKISSSVRPAKKLRPAFGDDPIAVDFPREFPRVNDALGGGGDCLQGMAFVLNGAKHLWFGAIIPAKNLHTYLHHTHPIDTTDYHRTGQHTENHRSSMTD
jgi:hypothetical protein